MIATITPAKIEGTLTVPASKSVMQRACALALLNNGTTLIKNPGKSNDDLTAIDIIKILGADISIENSDLFVKSAGIPQPGKIISCGESGLSLRMFAAIAALAPAPFLLQGQGSLLQRPMHFIERFFPQLGVTVNSNAGFLPIHISGPLHPKDITIDGSASSQYVTGLLFAFAKAAKKRLTITVNDLVSRPYIDLSLQVLGHFGYNVINENYKNFHINPGPREARNIVYDIEGDWSSASFLLVAGAIAGRIKLKGLNLGSSQADKAIVEVLISCNADVSMAQGIVTVAKRRPLMAFSFDATNCPDLFPPLVALAAYCDGVSVITGVSRLAEKESNRAQTLRDVFSKMGIAIVLQNDQMIITGNTGLKGADVSSYNDHRVLMAAAVAALGADGSVSISGAETVNKSYPGFFDDLKMLSVPVSLQQSQIITHE